MTLIELSTHLEEKTAGLQQEGLGKIKVALVGCNTTSLLETLEGAFGFIDQENISTASISEVKEKTKEDSPSSPPISSPEERSPVGTELVFLTQSFPLVVDGIPETLLPLCGPEAQSHYRCQFPDCTQIFLQKAATCIHICCDHLNVVLACLYCSGKDNPKMWVVQCFSLRESHL